MVAGLKTRDACASAQSLAGGLAAATPPTAIAADQPTMAIAPGATVTAAIDTSGDVDLFTITLVAGETYSFSLEGTGAFPLFDPILKLSLNGVEVATDDDGGVGIESHLTFTATQSGTYQISASAFPNSPILFPPTGEYTLAVRQMGADAIGNTIGTATAIPTAVSTHGFIETSGDVDVYAVTLTEGMYYAFDVAGGTLSGNLDTSLTIYGADGVTVASNANLSYLDVSSALGFIAEESGTYYVAVSAAPDLTGGYILQTSAFDLSNADVLDSIDGGGQLASNAVTVYFAPAGETFAGVTSMGWTAYEIEQAMEALQTYADVSDLTFSITTDASAATFKLVTTETDDYVGFFVPPGAPNAGVGVFDTDYLGWDTPGGLEPGGSGFAWMVHEFGHGLGLAHTHDGGGASETMLGVHSPYSSFGVFNLNQGLYTVMSYNLGWMTHPDGAGGSTVFGRYAGPGALDIAVIQSNYGVSEHNTGDTVYTVPTANAAGTYWDVIWDTGGTDAIVHSGLVPAHIDLTAATLDYSATGGGVISYASGIAGGFTIAGGVVIENATGGSGADTIAGNDAANILNGGLGADIIVGRGGADTFRGTAAELSGDTITDFSAGDRIVVSNASLASFQFALSGSTLTYSGGSMTLQGGVAGYLVASAAAGGGVQLTLSNTPPPPATVRSKLILTESGQDVTVGGNVAVFGTTTGGEVIEIVRGNVTLDASFNAGGDTVVLPGNAGTYTAILTGSFVTIAGGDVTVAIPVGTAGLAVQFADSTRTLEIEGGQVLLGSQQITSSAQPVAPSGPPLVDAAETGPDSFAKLILTAPGQDVDIGGNVNVTGTSAAGEVITVLGGEIRLDASFNAGGDTVVLSGEASDYSASLSGSFVTITDGETSVAIPVGLEGLTVDFSDVNLTLRIDAASGTVRLGDQEITSSDAPVQGAAALGWAKEPEADAQFAALRFDLELYRLDITDSLSFA